MALAMKPSCDHRTKGLASEGEAFVCSYECTFFVRPVPANWPTAARTAAANWTFDRGVRQAPPLPGVGPPVGGLTI